jgi:hypothetical protein
MEELMMYDRLVDAIERVVNSDEGAESERAQQVLGMFESGGSPSTLATFLSWFSVDDDEVVSVNA